MDKIQIIEKLFYLAVVYSYLLLPILFLFNLSKKKELLIISAYGLLFFGLLNAYEHLPNRSLKIVYLSVYTFLEYSVFAYLVASSIKKRGFQIFAFVLSFCFFSFQIVYFLIADFKRLDSVPIGVETILMFIYIAYYFYHYFKTGTDKYIYYVPSFWISVGILIYLGGTFFFNILVNHVDKNQFDSFWHLTYLPEIIKNILFAVSIILFSRQSKKNMDEKTKSVPYLDMI